MKKYKMRRICEEIELTVARAAKQLMALDEQVLSHKASAAKWSRKEIIGHLCDSAYNNIQRFVRAQYEEKPKINYEQDTWVNISAYNTFTKEELITLWKSLNFHVCKILEQMPAKNYTNTCVMMSMANGTKEFTLHWVAEDYLRHLQHHVAAL